MIFRSSSIKAVLLCSRPAVSMSSTSAPPFCARLSASWAREAGSVLAGAVTTSCPERAPHTCNRSTRFGKEVTQEEVRETLGDEIGKILAPVARPLEIDRSRKPFVILMTGVNGAGKTTTIGKLAARYRQDGLSCMLAAGDTFRAAAVEQLQVWGARSGVEVVTAPANTDPASLAHDALARARKSGVDVLMIDTAGRLHNKTALMEELRKIIRVLRKQDPTAPHATLLTLDATTGQNAVTQVGIFKEMVELTGLVVTKLDGSARGGIVVALAEKFSLPIHAVGTGEQIADLREFDAVEFGKALVGE